MTQQEVADAVGMTRENYSQVETGRRKEPLTPYQAIAISKLFGLPMLTIVSAMGYPIEVDGFESEEEVVLLRQWRKLSPAQQFVLRAAVEAGSQPERE